MEIQIGSNLDRDKILALYLVLRTKFLVSFTQKILFAFNKDTFGSSLDTEPVSGSGSPIQILSITPVLKFMQHF